MRLTLKRTCLGQFHHAEGIILILGSSIHFKLPLVSYTLGDVASVFFAGMDFTV